MLGRWRGRSFVVLVALAAIAQLFGTGGAYPGSARPHRPSIASLPRIAGTLVQGRALTASTGSWTGSVTSYRYSWYACNTPGTRCVGVSGASGSTHRLTASDVGHRMRVAVTAANRAGSSTARSSATMVVKAAVAVGTANVWVDANGGTCVRRASPGGYVDAQACASLNAAYRAAQGWDTIDVRCGTYASQTINSRSLDASTVTIQKDRVTAVAPG